MSSTILQLVRRDGSKVQMSGTIYDLIVVLLVLVCLILVLVGTLMLLRRRRRARRDVEEMLPEYTEKRISTASNHSHHRRVTARPSQSIHIIPNEKETLMEHVSPPSSPTESIPEIRVTFPEEVDEAGKRQSGKVVVVRVGDTGIGLEPLAEQPPAYQQSEGERFQSIDLERVGGLVERARSSPKWQ